MTEQMPGELTCEHTARRALGVREGATELLAPSARHTLEYHLVAAARSATK